VSKQTIKISSWVTDLDISC